MFYFSSTSELTMASSGENYDLDALVAKLKEFSLTQTKNASKMDSKTVGKMAKECWPKPLQTRIDSSVFPKVMDKTTKSVSVLVGVNSALFSLSAPECQVKVVRVRKLVSRLIMYCI